MPVKLQQIMALLALFLVAVPMLLTALLVAALLGRPLLFHQQRIGYRKAPFTISKFRTMKDLRDEDGNLLPDREREIPLTRILRRIRLDESPQLFTILLGKMVWIGPRPLLPQTIESFGALGDLRCSVRPGLTGWAQINGNTYLSDRQKLALDIWYVDHRSFKLDCYILMQTAITILKGEKIDAARLERAELHLKQKGRDLQPADGA